MSEVDQKSGYEETLVPLPPTDGETAVLNPITNEDPGDETTDIPARPISPEDIETLFTDLHTYIVSCLDLAEYLHSENHGGRELANAIERLEEAEMWLLKGLQPPEGSSK